MRGHSGETFHSRAGPRGGTRPERGWSCCLGQSPSPCPVFPGPPASQPALPGRRWRLGSAGRLFSVGPVFAPLPGRAGAALALQSGQGRSRARGEGAEPVPAPGGTRGSADTGSAGDPAAGEGAERPRGWRGRARQPRDGLGAPAGTGSVSRGTLRSSCPATAGSAACSPRPRLRAAGIPPAAWPLLLAIPFPLFERRQQLLLFPHLDSTS